MTWGELKQQPIPDDALVVVDNWTRQNGFDEAGALEPRTIFNVQGQLYGNPIRGFESKPVKAVIIG